MNHHSSQFYIPPINMPYDNHQGHQPQSRRNHNWKRLLLFAGIFIVSAAISLSYTFKRPAIFQSSAELLIEPQNLNQRDQDTSTHDIALQHQVLLSRDLLTDVLDNLPPIENNHKSERLTLSSLQSMLQVIPLADSAILKLQAEGPEKKILPIIINKWVDRYIDLNSQTQKKHSDVTSESLQHQLEALKNKISTKQKKLNSFRDEYDIVSMVRDENKILSILRGLNASLNKATQTRTIAEANRFAVKDAIERGSWAGNYKKTSELMQLEGEAELLREQVSDYEARYTTKFIQLDKDTRATINRLNRIEEKIQLTYQELRTAAIEEAEQEIKSARETERNLKKQIADYEKKASLFSARFSEHESLKEDLLRLENLNRDFQEKLVAIEIKSDGDMPHVKVLERPFLPEAPVRPNYKRDAGISMAASLLLGILAILLYDLFTKSVRQQNHQTAYPVTYNQIFQNAPKPLQDPSYIQQTGILLPPVEQLTPRELSATELEKLYKSADNITRRLIVSLVNGLDFEEAVNLRWKHINLETNELKTPGTSPRIIQLTELYRSVLEKDPSPLMDPESSVLQNKNGDVIPANLLEEYISQAAQNARIAAPEEVTVEALRHTYIAFLARHGVTLREIVERVGYIPNEHHAVYDIMRPPGSYISIKNIEMNLPALREDI